MRTVCVTFSKRESAAPPTREVGESGEKKAGFSAFLPDDPALFADVDVVFNTIPSPIVTPRTLAELREPTLYLELASAPGGLSEEGKHHPLLEVVDCGGLPGRFCPNSAGKFVAQAVICHLGEEGEQTW